jgi:hypothetical protein
MSICRSKCVTIEEEKNKKKFVDGRMRVRMKEIMEECEKKVFKQVYERKKSLSGRLF